MDIDNSTFLLVEWVGENRFSIISRAKIVEEEKRNQSDDKLVGEEILCTWKHKKYSAKVIQCGEKINLEYELGILTGTENLEDDNLETGGPIANGNAAADAIDEVLSGSSNVDCQNQIDYKTLYEKEVERSLKFKNKAKTLKRKLKDRKAEEQEEVVRLSGAVTIKKSQLDMIKTISGGPTVFARNLMRIVFRDEELNNKSMYGRKCNANSSPAKPSIDDERRDAIITHTLQVYCDGKPDKGTLNDVHRSLGDYIREVNRKLQRKD